MSRSSFYVIPGRFAVNWKNCKALKQDTSATGLVLEAGLVLGLEPEPFVSDPQEFPYDPKKISRNFQSWKIQKNSAEMRK